MLKAAWESVKKETIVNCFRHAGFTVGAEAVEEPTEDVEGSEEVVELDEMWSDFSRFVGDASDTLTQDNFVDDDDVSEVVAELTDVEIAAKVTRQRIGIRAAEVEHAVFENIPLPTSSEALAGLFLAQSYCSAMEDTRLKLVECLDMAEQGIIRHVINQKKKQATLPRFFSPQ
ncbi:hypothetical protein HPB51_012528 [Rhipicephalus microplus]|uniref:Tick transposon n=1 Tax=Rhipicephalus microplus TaxID=6941 RepID=A0A9J6DG88_RHIMP|nr:hypothetical protein HPB51_012528 [Rhipicephalus microplus]